MPSPEQAIATITLLGKDRTGVVARVTQSLFEEGANIESLEEHVERGRFHMSLMASWPAGRIDDAGEKRIHRLFRTIGEEVRMETRVRFHHAGRRQRMAVFVTRESHVLDAVLEAVHRKEVDADVALVVSNRRYLEKPVKAKGLAFRYIPFEDRDAAEERLVKLLDRDGVDFLVLARFMKILSPGFCWRYRNKIINIHPSLLPAFPGATAYRQAWEKGVRVVGVTAHFVTPDLDQGPIIAQEAFKVDPEDDVRTIVRKGQELEGKVVIEAIQLYLKKRLDVHWGRVWTA